MKVILKKLEDIDPEDREKYYYYFGEYEHLFDGKKVVEVNDNTYRGNNPTLDKIYDVIDECMDVISSKWFIEIPLFTFSDIEKEFEI